MRIIAGEWRGRHLTAPSGQATRPTADRVRQALFDILVHAEWAGRDMIDGAVVLDVFAGTGALGLEALSRGAAVASFIESDATALRALRANVAACRAEGRALVLAGNALTIPLPALARHRPAHETQTSPSIDPPDQLQRRPSRAPFPDGRKPIVQETAGGMKSGQKPASLLFLDPPYGQDLIPRALSRLNEAGCIGQSALIVAEIGHDETWRPPQPLLAERQHGAARILIFRAA